MKRLYKRLRMSTFLRFACSYLLMLALILSVLFSYMYTFVQREVQQRTLVSQHNRLARIAYQHEDHLKSMVNTAVQIGLSPAITPFSRQLSPDRAYYLIKQLAPYTVTNTYADQIYLCFSGQDHIYSATSSMTMDLFLDIIHYEHVAPEMLEEAIRKPGNMTILPAQQVESVLLPGTNTEVITVILPLGASPTASKGSVLFLLKASLYEKLFSDAIDSRLRNTYVIQNGKILVSETDFDIPEETILAAAMEGGQQVTLQWGGETWHLLNQRSDNWSLHYVTLLRASDMTLHVQGSMMGVSMLWAGVAALGVVIALWMAQRNSRPIREIASMLPKKAEEDAFTSIQTGIRELSARNTDLHTRLERSLPMQRHDFVLRFMKGRCTDREDAIRASAALGMNINRPFYAIILSGVQDRSEQPLDLRSAPFDSLVQTTVFGVELMALKAHLYLVFSDTQEEIPRTAQFILEACNGRNGQATVALSGIQTDFSVAPSAYLEAATAFENRFVMDDSGLLSFDSISTSIQDILPKARRITESISQALSLRNHPLLSDRIDELLRFLKYTSMSPFAFRLIYNDVIDKLLREHARTGTSGRSLLDYYDIFTLSSCQSIDDLDALLRQLCDAIISAQPAEPADEQPENAGAISQVAAYIRSHFDDPELSIGAIAEAFEMPTARLSLAFKDVMHMSPLEYLTLLRVEKSKELLEGTELSIKDIAARVGYYDASSFTRRFKQITGHTPLTYRRSKEDDHAES